jgi:predicted XRE-type DNA-binding protein
VTLRGQLVELLLSELRLQGVSQAWLADQAGITQKHVSQIMTGRADGSFALWDRMFSALDVAPVVDLRDVEPSSEVGS